MDDETLNVQSKPIRQSILGNELCVPLDDALDALDEEADLSDGQLATEVTQEVRVVVRIRNSQEEHQVVKVESNQKLKIVKARKSVFGVQQSSWENYEVTRAFAPRESQEDVFDGIGKRPADDALKGYKALIVAIGNTGTGKTHTLYGPPEIFSDKKAFRETDVGLVFRTLDYVMAELRNYTHLKHYELRLGVFELFSEGKSILVRDLLNIKHRTLSKDDSFVDSLTWKAVRDRKQAAGYISQAFECRKVSSHNLNAHSSRSFLFMPVKILQWQSDVKILEGEMMFVDFAGWEQAKTTGAVGDVLKEATFINSQLLAWSKCLDALAGKKAHVPYHEASLTKLLRVYLEESIVTMILCASPDYSRGEDTRNILRKIKNISRIITKARRTSRRATFEERMTGKNSVFPGRLEQLELENYGLKVAQETHTKEMEELEEKVRRLEQMLTRKQGTEEEEGKATSEPGGRAVAGAAQMRDSLRPSLVGKRSPTPKSDIWDDPEFSENESDNAHYVEEKRAADSAKLAEAEKIISEMSIRLKALEETVKVDARLNSIEKQLSASTRLESMEQRLHLMQTQQNTILQSQTVQTPPPQPTPPPPPQNCCTLS